MIYEKLKHTKWECEYHVIFIPKFRKKVIFGKLRQKLGSVLRGLSRQKESRIEKDHLMLDHY
jgi:putative transposase